MNLSIPLFALASMLPQATPAQENEPKPKFETATQSVQRQLEESLTELASLRERMAAEKLPMARQLRELEAELVRVRAEYQTTSRTLDSRTLDLSNLRNEIKARQDETTYLSTLLGEYARNFDSRLHIAEVDRYAKVIEDARLAPENTTLSELQVFEVQAALLEASLVRLEDALGGTRFQGAAVDGNGTVKPGVFVMAGPAAIFRSDDGLGVGVVEQRLGSLEPAIVPFGKPEDVAAARRSSPRLRACFPLDPTLGNAVKVEAIEETWVEHVQKGGPVMWPIFVSRSRRSWSRS
jgi:biopolymer transport protein ExbB